VPFCATATDWPAGALPLLADNVLAAPDGKADAPLLLAIEAGMVEAGMNPARDSILTIEMSFSSIGVCAEFGSKRRRASLRSFCNRAPAEHGRAAYNALQRAAACHTINTVAGNQVE
jgi:hypothetical protein